MAKSIGITIAIKITIWDYHSLEGGPPCPPQGKAADTEAGPWSFSEASLWRLLPRSRRAAGPRGNTEVTLSAESSQSIPNLNLNLNLNLNRNRNRNQLPRRGL